jgi:bis(5'-nucleosyl)-tetraphosphatase (symmetrical)
MTTYVIGDLQGCLSSFEQLAAQLPAADRYIFVGDLVNRGFESLATLRHVKARVERGEAVTLLGNHDLHLLATASGVRPLKDGDTLQDVLDAPDCEELLAWVRSQPLAHFEDGVLFVHAGVLPPWTVEQTLSLADEVHRSLAADDDNAFLRQMYGDKPRRWSDDLTGNDRLRCVVNALTRLRVLSSDGAMNLKHKDSASKAPRGDMPWFDHPQRATRDTPVVFGHWSAEGLVARANVIGLDTGCVWGGKLTALRLHDRALFQLDCPVSQSAEE